MDANILFYLNVFRCFPFFVPVWCFIGSSVGRLVPATLMLSQHPMGECAVSQQFDGAVEVTFQPLVGVVGVRARPGFAGWVVVERFVDAGNGLDLLQHRADVVANEDDGALFIDFGQ